MKADLHVHSKHSNRPTEWLLQQFRAPESFSEPREIYRLCRARGMDFVTVSDHDSLAGSLEIAHLPGTFLSSEVTVSFPEDGCHIHLLVTGVTEAQFAEIARLSGNVYELRDYLAREDVICSVAHPLFRVNDRLTLAHVEKLLVLFNRFEALNGIHDRLANDLVRRVFGALDRETLADMAERHRLLPWGERPWIKRFTGGSDDHGGFYAGTTWTETPPAASVEELLAHLRAGASEPAGATGSTLRLTQSLYSITYEYYRRRFLPLLGERDDPFARLLRELARRPAPGQEAAGPRARSFSLLAPFRRFRPSPVSPSDTGPSPELAIGGFSSRASRDALYALARDLVRHLRRGRLAECLGAVSNLAPLGLAVAPFLVALRAQHKDAGLLAETGRRFLGPGFELRAGGTAWFADGPLPGAWGEEHEELDEDEKTAGGEPAPAPERVLAAALAERRGRVTAIACGAAPARAAGLPAARFQPLGELPLPLLPGRSAGLLALPPAVEVLEHCERERYSEVLVATPGPLGLLGLAAGKLLGLHLVGICDPGLPERLHRSTGDYSVADVAWDYLRWFYGQMDAVHVPRAGDVALLASRGFDAARLAPLEEEAPRVQAARRAERQAAQAGARSGETIAA